MPLRASQRRRLAVLAFLATSRRRPVGRDRLTALLWPDAEPDHARHLLADSIYVLRDSLGEDVLLTSGENVSLNPALVSSDVGKFMEALDAHDFEAAVRIYSEGGRFLDGVHLADSPEFERWSDTTARELEHDYRRAIEELAQAAALRGAHPESIRWWKKLAGEDRASSRIALELMRALEASGDIAGAIEFAGTHEKLVRAEIDSAPDPSVIAFANELRARPKPKKSVLPPDAVSEPGTVAIESPTVVLTRRHSGARRAAFGIVTVAVIAAVTYGALEAPIRRSAAGDASGRGPSIVVLPLRNITPGEDNESFADGMTEELISSLSKISRLRVIASTSAYAFESKPADVKEITEKLRVSNVLEGGVQRSGSRMRLSIRLIDAADGSTRWSEVYDRDVKDLFAVEDEIGRAVAGRLNLLLEGRSIRPRGNRTTSVEAYDFYLRGRHQRELRSDSAMKAAMIYFKRAVTFDSGYTAAYAGLSEACTQLAFTNNSRDFPRAKLLECGEASANKAVQLDDSLSEAHTALGLLRLAHHIDFSIAEKELKRALELDHGNRQAHEDLAIVYGSTERCDLALAEAREAEEVDPLSVTAIREVGRALYCARRYDEALRELNRARSLGPPVRNIPLIAGPVYAKKGMIAQAIAELQRGPTHSWARALLGHMYGLAGNTREASRILAELTAQFDAGTGSAFSVAVVYAGLRDYDNAFAWLDKSFDDSSIRANIMDPLFDDLRADPRFRSVRARLGIQ